MPSTPGIKGSANQTIMVLTASGSNGHNGENNMSVGKSPAKQPAIASNKGRNVDDLSEHPAAPPAKKVEYRGTNPYEDVNTLGSDGKPLAVKVGVLRKLPTYPVFAKLKFRSDTKSQKLM